MKNKVLSDIIFELLNPPDNINNIDCVFCGLVSINKDIKEPANKFTAKPVSISFVIENLFNPAKQITDREEIRAPANPNKE